MPSGRTQPSLMFYACHIVRKEALLRDVSIMSRLILSTVYLKYHYVIDLFVGTVIAVA